MAVAVSMDGCAWSKCRRTSSLRSVPQSSPKCGSVVRTHILIHGGNFQEPLTTYEKGRNGDNREEEHPDQRR